MTTVTDILQKNDKWMQSEDIVEATAKEFNISTRQAYRTIEKAVKNNEIRKMVLSDRSTHYGLPNWTLTTLSKNKKEQEKPIFPPKEAISLAYFKVRGKEVRFYRALADYLIWFRRGAQPNEKPKDD